jgi:hypothetical protein
MSRNCPDSGDSIGQIGFIALKNRLTRNLRLVQKTFGKEFFFLLSGVDRDAQNSEISNFQSHFQPVAGLYYVNRRFFSPEAFGGTIGC